MAPIYGYLMTLSIADMLKAEKQANKKTLGIFSRKKQPDSYQWDEKFYVLSSIGLIIMDKPNSDRIEFYQHN